MSLVGPRPCIPYETENFAPYQLERFAMPQGITGLWQVTARANCTYGEALDMDVAYVRGWSLGLDLRLLLRTPLRSCVSGPRPHDGVFAGAPCATGERLDSGSDGRALRRRRPRRR